MKLSIIVAVSENRVIGRGGDLPWRLSADLRRFKRLTMGHHLIMGRKTYESIGRPLPGRTTIVISRQPDLRLDGVRVVNSLQQAIQSAEGDSEVFVTGGAEIYQIALPLAHQLYLTRVHTQIDGDTFFPKYDADQWNRTEQDRHTADENNHFDYSFEVYQRIDLPNPELAGQEMLP